MHAHWRQVLHQAVAVVVSARRASVWLLPVIGFVTGVLCRFSRTWLSVVTLGTSLVTLCMVGHILHTRHRHARALSLTSLPLPFSRIPLNIKHLVHFERHDVVM